MIAKVRTVKLALTCLLVTTLLGIFGCGAGSLSYVAKYPSLSPSISAIPRPNLFLVKNFEIKDAIFSGNNIDNTAFISAQRRKIPEELKNNILDQFAQRNLTARDYSKDVINTPDALVVDGSITEVNNGSGATRFWIGFGAGKAMIIAKVKVYNTRDTNIMLAEFGANASSQGSINPGDLTSGNLSYLATTIADYIEKQFK